MHLFQVTGVGLFQHRQQAPGGNILLHLECCQPRHAQPTQHQLAQRIAVAGAGVATGQQHAFAPVLQQRPALHRARMADIQPVVRLQLLGSAWQPVPLRVGRCSHDHHPRRAQPPRHQARALQRTGPHRHVGALLQQVDHLVVEGQVHAYLRIALQERRQQRQQEMLAERHVGIDPQASTRLGVSTGAALGLVQVGQHAQAALVERAALGSQLQLAGGTLQQARPQPLFQPRHQLADRRRGHLQRSGGCGKAPVSITRTNTSSSPDRLMSERAMAMNPVHR